MNPLKPSISLLRDSEVIEWRKEMDKMAMLPVKRT